MAWKFNKQRLVAPNVLVCYTTSHGQATTAALERNWGRRGLREIGDALRTAHDRVGGLTQLLAVVWRDRGVPRVIELTPPEYQQSERTGIVGIGDHGTLKWFRENFEEDPRPRLDKSTASPEMLAALAKQFGQEFEFPEPTYSIDEAALNVAGALTVGMRLQGGRSVGPPLQVMVVHRGAVRQIPIVTLDKGATRVTPATIDHRQTKLPAAAFPKVKEDRRRLRAEQLFD